MYQQDSLITDSKTKNKQLINHSLVHTLWLAIPLCYFGLLLENEFLLHDQDMPLHFITLYTIFN